MSDISANQNTEREIKQLLTQDMHDRIVSLTLNRPVYQTNYYFDTVCHDLDKNGISMRLRHKDASWELTVKIHSEKTDTAIISKEINIPVSDAQAKEYLENINPDVLNKILAENGCAFRADTLKYIGSLRTKRVKVPINELGVVFELDESTYLGITDHEVECELTDMSKADAVIKWLRDRNMMPAGKMKGKYGRFLSRLKQVEEK